MFKGRFLLLSLRLYKLFVNFLGSFYSKFALKILLLSANSASIEFNFLNKSLILIVESVFFSLKFIIGFHKELNINN